ncbi:MAG: hypothetical protein NVSMB25_16330 [Thermoleophilaceae bacterium]
MTDDDRSEEAVAEREGDGKAASGNGDDSAEGKAKQKEKESEEAAEEMRKLEEGDPPKDLSDWPDGPAKYKTFGNDDDEAYGDGVTAKLGPADLKRFEDGSVEIDGEKVENPDEHKGDPIPGGPTDENTPDNVA